MTIELVMKREIALEELNEKNDNWPVHLPGIGAQYAYGQFMTRSDPVSAIIFRCRSDKVIPLCPKGEQWPQVVLETCNMFVSAMLDSIFLEKYKIYAFISMTRQPSSRLTNYWKLWGKMEEPLKCLETFPQAIISSTKGNTIRYASLININLEILQKILPYLLKEPCYLNTIFMSNKVEINEKQATEIYSEAFTEDEKFGDDCFDHLKWTQKRLEHGDIILWPENDWELGRSELHLIGKSDTVNSLGILPFEENWKLIE